MTGLDPAESERRSPALDLRTALTCFALMIGTGFVLIRAEAVKGFGPFAAVVAAAVWIIAWTLAVLGGGRPMVRWITGRPSASWEDEVTSAVGGVAILVACAAGLSVVGLFRPWPLLVTLLLWAAVGFVDVVRHPISRPTIDLRVAPLLGLAGLAALIATSASPFYDQWHQHLGFPWIWLQSGSIHAVPNDWYSFMPVNSSLIFAYGLGTLGIWSAQIIHWWCGFVTVLAVVCLAARSGEHSASVWAAWIFATTPVVLHLTTTAGSDLVVALFAAGAWMALLRTVDGEADPGKWWVVAGVCVGLAIGTKYIAIGTVAVPVGIASVILHRPWRSNHRRLWLRHVSMAVVATAVVFSPWAIRNFVATGNPLFPFANEFFAWTLRLPAEMAGEFSTNLSGFDTSLGHIVSGLDLESFHASIDGFPSIGFVYLSLTAFVVFIWTRLRRQPSVSPLAAGALAGVAFWLLTMHVSRYLIPVLVPAAAVLGAAMADLTRALSPRLRASVVALVALVATLNLAASVTPIGVERLGTVVGVRTAEPLLARWVSSTPAFEAVASLDANAKVFLVAEARALGFERPVVFCDPYRDPLLLELARTAKGSRGLAEKLQEMGVTHVLANRWEAVRAARLRGNDRFFVIADPDVGNRLGEFCADCLEPVWSDAGLFLYRLVPECTVPRPGGSELATW